MFAFCDYQADENFVQLRYDRLDCEVVRNLELRKHSNEPFQASTVVACNPLSLSTILSLQWSKHKVCTVFFGRLDACGLCMHCVLWKIRCLWFVYALCSLED
jgi:hypothetical protein